MSTASFSSSDAVQELVPMLAPIRQPQKDQIPSPQRSRQSVSPLSLFGVPVLPRRTVTSESPMSAPLPLPATPATTPPPPPPLTSAPPPPPPRLGPRRLPPRDSDGLAAGIPVVEKMQVQLAQNGRVDPGLKALARKYVGAAMAIKREDVSPRTWEVSRRIVLEFEALVAQLAVASLSIKAPVG